jgi:hypothetical protein
MLSVRFGLLKAPLVLARLNIHKLLLLIIPKAIALGLDMEAEPHKVHQYGSLIVGCILFCVFACYGNTPIHFLSESSSSAKIGEGGQQCFMFYEVES